MNPFACLAPCSATRQRATVSSIFFATLLVPFALLAMAVFSGCGSASNAPAIAAGTPVAGSTATATAKATAQASFYKFLAEINAFNANIAKDNGSPAQQQLLIDASGAGLAAAVAVAGDGVNSAADVATLSSAVKAINDVAQLPSVQSLKSSQVKAAITAAAGTGNNANALASKAALIFDAATAKGATPKSALLAINQGFAQGNAQAASAAVQAAAPAVSTP